MQRGGLPTRLLALVICWAGFTHCPLAQALTKYPGVNYISPLAVTKGKKTIITVSTNGDIKSVYKVLTTGTGISAKVLPWQKKQKAGIARFELTVSKDAAVGPRDLRLATKEALTTVARFYVTDYDITQESPNPKIAQMKFQFPAALCGRIEREIDEDWFEFQAKKGELVNFAVMGNQLQDCIHKIGRFVPHFDSTLVLTDANGVELTANDDHFFSDPLLTYTIPADGTYRLGIRESTFKGNSSYTYAILATKGARAISYRPLAVEIGKSTELTVQGPGLEKPVKVNVKSSADARPDFLTVVEPNLKGKKLPEVSVLATDLPVMEENTKVDNDPLKQAQQVAMPIAIEGVLEKPGDIDHYAFTARAGQKFRFEVFSRRVFSPVDTVMEIVDVRGRRQTANDDGKVPFGRSTKDSSIEWTAKRPGRYILRITDVLGRGGDEFAYHLQMRDDTPDFIVTCDPDLVMVGPGSRSPMYVRVHRNGKVDQRINLEVKGLPKGITASKGFIDPKMEDGLIVLECQAGAKIDATQISIEASTQVTINGKKQKLTRTAIGLAEIYQSTRRIPTELVTVAVTEPSDIKVETTTKEVVLKPGQSVEIPVTVVRAAKYKDGRVGLDGSFDRSFGSTLPPGVKVDTKKSKLTINGKDSKGKLVLVADKNAKPIEKIPSVVIGQVSVEFRVYVPYCTQAFNITVKP